MTETIKYCNEMIPTL